MLTPEQIAQKAESFNGLANRAAINRLFRAQDESDLYPIQGRFNATERAIRRLRKQAAAGLCIGEGLEYALSLEAEISYIVNVEC